MFFTWVERCTGKIIGGGGNRDTRGAQTQCKVYKNRAKLDGKRMRVPRVTGDTIYSRATLYVTWIVGKDTSSVPSVRNILDPILPRSLFIPPRPRPPSSPLYTRPHTGISRLNLGGYARSSPENNRRRDARTFENIIDRFKQGGEIFYPAIFCAK